MSFISELKRRRLVQVGVTALVVAWGVAQVADLLLENFQAEDWIMKVVLVALGIGCIVAGFSMYAGTAFTARAN